MSDLNSKNEMIQALRKRLRHLAVAMQGVEATAMHIATNDDAELSGEDMAEIACQVGSIRQSTRSLSHTLTPVWINSSELEEDLSHDQIKLIRAFCMTPEQRQAHDNELLAEMNNELDDSPPELTTENFADTVLGSVTFTPWDEKSKQLIEKFEAQYNTAKEA